MKLYHGTDVDVKIILEAGLIPKNENYLGLNRWGVFLTEDETTAQKYGCNIFSVEIDEQHVDLSEDETECEAWIFADYIDADDLTLESTRSREIGEAEREWLEMNGMI